MVTSQTLLTRSTTSLKRKMRSLRAVERMFESCQTAGSATPARLFWMLSTVQMRAIFCLSRRQGITAAGTAAGIMIFIQSIPAITTHLMSSAWPRQIAWTCSPRFRIMGAIPCILQLPVSAFFQQSGTAGTHITTAPQWRLRTLQARQL